MGRFNIIHMGVLKGLTKILTSYTGKPWIWNLSRSHNIIYIHAI